MILAFLDASDTILEIVTYDSTTIRNTLAMAEAFRTIGYPPDKVRYLVNRADSTGGIDPAALAGRSAGRPSSPSCPTAALVVECQQRGGAVRAGGARRGHQPGRCRRWPAPCIAGRAAGGRAAR